MKSIIMIIIIYVGFVIHDIALKKAPTIGDNIYTERNFRTFMIIWTLRQA